MASPANHDAALNLTARQLSFSLPDASSPDFEAEYRRQMALVAEHDRGSGSADRLETDEDTLRGWI